MSNSALLIPLELSLRTNIDTRSGIVEKATQLLDSLPLISYVSQMVLSVLEGNHFTVLSTMSVTW